MNVAPPRQYGTGISEVHAGALPYGGRLMFTQSWEDPRCDLQALRPAPGETILAVTSGCDNVLQFLLSDPREIISVDLNPTQNYLLELKSAAFQVLSHDQMLELLGVTKSARPADLYRVLRPELTSECRAFWDSRVQWFDRGLLVQGGFERYFAVLRALIRLAVGRRRMERLFTLDPGEQRSFYESQWNGPRWRALIRLGCSKLVLGNRLDPSWFEHADVESFGDHFRALGEHVLVEIPARSNYFIAQILLGRYWSTDEVPAYLKPENFETIRARLNRISPVTADIGQAVDRLGPESVDCFALSNVFEYSPPDLFHRTCGALARAAKPGARLALRNLVGWRSLKDHAAFYVDDDMSRQLQAADRAFIYSRFEAARLHR